MCIFDQLFTAVYLHLFNIVGSLLSLFTKEERTVHTHKSNSTNNTQKNILFVVTSASNMGDLALCQEWIQELGRTDYQFGFIISPNLQQFVAPEDQTFPFSTSEHVKKTVLNTIARFSAHALIFATNAFWNLPDCEGAVFGKFLLEKDDVNIPVFSFDPFEIGFNHQLPQNGLNIQFSAVPPWVFALRYMSRYPRTSNAIHFKTNKVYGNRSLKDPQIISKYGGDSAKKSIIFPISKDRYEFIQEHYPGYYAYLAELFSELPHNVQVFTVLPKNSMDFDNHPNIVQLSHIPFEDFQDLVQSADIYLTDSYISCIVTAFQLETPALLLINSNDTPSESSFLLHQPFKYKVFPYGMYDICEELEQLFEVKDCFIQCEIFDRAAFHLTISQLLNESIEKKQLEIACQQWKNARKNLQSPSHILEAILREVTHNSL